MLIAGLVVTKYAEGHRIQADPNKGAAIETIKLKKLTAQLQTSLQKPNAKPNAGNIKAYLRLMQSISASCKRVAIYDNTKHSLTLSQDTTTRLDNAAQLCGDLTKLTNSSSYIYTSLSPLLTTNSQLRRWQTLAPLVGSTRSRHNDLVSRALTKVNRQDILNSAFPTALPGQLKDLQQTINHSPKLGYLPTLHSFQLGAWGERISYWNDYADLPTLQKALETQLSGLCQSANAIRECRK